MRMLKQPEKRFYQREKVTHAASTAIDHQKVRNLEIKKTLRLKKTMNLLPLKAIIKMKICLVKPLVRFLRKMLI